MVSMQVLGARPISCLTGLHISCTKPLREVRRSAELIPHDALFLCFSVTIIYVRLAWPGPRMKRTEMEAYRRNHPQERVGDPFSRRSKLSQLVGGGTHHHQQE